MPLFENAQYDSEYAELSFSAYNKDLKGFNVLKDGTAPMNDIAY